MTPEQLFDSFLVAALLAGSAALGFRFLRRGAAGLAAGTRRAALVAAALLGLTLALRLWLFQPTFLHANFHGAAIVDSILAFPRAAQHRSTYGQGGFLLLGAIAALFGRSFEVVATANQVIGVATLGLAAWWAARWTDRPWLAPVVVALGALHPALIRTAASEDMHGPAVLLGWIALVAVDHFATRRDRLALACAVAATVLMVNTRQTLYLWALCVPLVALARGGRRLGREPAFLAGMGLVAAALLVRVVRTLLDVDNRYTVAMLPNALLTPAVLSTQLLRHPLLDITRFAALLLPLGLVGAAWMYRRGRLGRAFCLLLGAQLVFTMPFMTPCPGVEIAFRLPVMMLGVVAAAAGVEAVRARARAGGALLLVAASLSPALLPGWRELARPSPQDEEYRFLRQASAALPDGFVLAVVEPRALMPSYRVPRAALSAAGRQVRYADASELASLDFAAQPVLFLEGLQCRAHSLPELVGENMARSTTREALDRIARLVATQRVPDGVRLDPAPRPECARLLAHAEPFGPTAEVADPRPESPFVLYPPGPLPLRLHRLTAPP